MFTWLLPDTPVANANTSDPFSDFMSAPPAPPAGTQPASQPATSPANDAPAVQSQADSISGLFGGNDTSSTTAAPEPTKNTKESILALYGSSGAGGQQGFNMANAGE